MRPPRRSLAFLVSALLMAGCSSAGSTNGPATTEAQSPALTASSPTPSPRPTVDLDHPVGVIAMGHSGLTGEGTAGLMEANYEGSWATGTLESVNSIYMRLVEARPETEGNVANTAFGGAPAAALIGQLESALGQVHVPALAIIQTLDNDIECEAGNVPEIGQQILDAVTEIHEASPNTQILLVGQAGRPNVEGIEARVAADPSAKADLTWDDPCSFYGPDGNLRPEGVAMLSASIDAYEAEQSRVCALVPNCSTDGGVRKDFIEELEMFSSDWNHLNARGQAAQAELMWPVVERLLGL